MSNYANRKTEFTAIIRRAIVYAFLLAIFIFTIMPLIWTWMASLKTPAELKVNLFGIPQNGITFDNIINAWVDGKMSVYFKNSIIVAICRVTMVVVISSLAGYAFAKLHFPGKHFFLMFFMIGMTIPIQAMIIPLFFNMSRLGLVNTYSAMIIPFLGISAPFGILIMRSFFMDIPDEIMEAAFIDGSGEFQTFLKIVLPMASPAVVSLVIFEFMFAWKEYLFPLIFVYEDAFRTLPVGLANYKTQYTMDQSLTLAGVAISSVPIVIIYIIFRKQFVDGMTTGAVKG